LEENAVFFQYKAWSRHQYWLPYQGLKAIDVTGFSKEKPYLNVRRPVAVDLVQRYIDCVRQRLKVEDYERLTTTLKTINDTQEAMCKTCVEHRREEMKHAANRNHTLEQQRFHQRARLEAQKALKAHVQTCELTTKVQVCYLQDLIDKLSPGSLAPVAEPQAQPTAEEQKQDTSVLFETVEECEPLVWAGPKNRRPTNAPPAVGDLIVIQADRGSTEGPFWLARLTEITPTNFTLQWFGCEDPPYGKWYALNETQGENKVLIFFAHTPHVARCTLHIAKKRVLLKYAARPDKCPQ
jgi:hypothetical protein